MINLKPNKSELLSQILRVDHAGECAAVYIYSGQFKFYKSDLIKHMMEEEQVHFEYFDKAIVENRVRPTLLLPLWKGISFGLGCLTSIMGKKASMALTIAVEETIDSHYAEQIEQLKNYPELESLKQKIEIFRQEELEHRDTGVEHEGQDMLGYRIFSKIVKKGCKIAIAISRHI